jgi:hypothetical protein
MKNIISLPKFTGFYGEEFTDRYMDDRDEAFRDENYRVECSNYGYETRLKEEFPDIVKSVKYYSLDNPKEYNFRTDKVLAMVEFDKERLYFELGLFIRRQRAEFSQWLEENYSNRDGFISFIDTNLVVFLGELEAEFEEEESYSRNLTVIFEYLCLRLALRSV